MTTEEGEKLALKHDISFTEVSVTDETTGVDEAMTTLADLMASRFESLIVSFGDENRFSAMGSPYESD